MDDRHQCEHQSTHWRSWGYSFHLTFNLSLRFEVFIIKSFEGKNFLSGKIGLPTKGWEFTVKKPLFASSKWVLLKYRSLAFLRN